MTRELTGKASNGDGTSRDQAAAIIRSALAPEFQRYGSLQGVTDDWLDRIAAAAADSLQAAGLLTGGAP